MTAELNNWLATILANEEHEYKELNHYTLVEIKAIAECEPETIQDAILVHTNTDENGDGDCIIFGYSMDEIRDDAAVEDILFNEACPTYSNIREDGVYIANA